ncbi:nicotinamide riboside transporter PnuC [Intestinibacter sp.]|uniref:nicotinamide riboside transporter PnuC n=1 Tax=Intestinibacter sp. TaxID=1965304 RepID=UPI003F186416
MNKLKEVLRKEFIGWKKWEILWIAIATAVVLGVSIYWKDTAIGIFAALTGIWCVILTGKGKLSSFWFGTINTVLYAIVAWKARYWGEVMLNLIYYVPMNFVGMYMWSKNINEETEEVIKKRLSFKGSIIAYFCVAAGTVGYGFILRLIDGTLPFIDAMSTVFSIFAQILCVKRYMEQWVLWVIVDVVTVIMWVYAFINGTGDMATVLMWSVYLVNAIIMLVKWNKDTK